MEVCYIYTNENSIMKPTKPLFEKRGGGRGGMEISWRG
jgi:hypothetical protein